MARPATAGRIEAHVGVWIQLFVGDLLKVKADALFTSTASDAPGSSLPVHGIDVDSFHGSPDEVIAACVREALAIAERERFAHVAIPVFVAGNGRFDFREAVRAMQAALAAHDAQVVDLVTIAVPDLTRADEARRLLSADKALAVSSERDEELMTWVAPLYLHVLHGNHLRLRVSERDEFVAETRRVLAQADETGLRLLLWDGNWRPRLTAAWLAGIQRRMRLEPLIAELLLASEVTFAGQGYCFALARFATPSAADALASYLERWLARTDGLYEQHWALAALERIDPKRAGAYYGAWTHFQVASNVSDESLEEARETLGDLFAFASAHLDDDD